MVALGCLPVAADPPAGKPAVPPGKGSVSESGKFVPPAGPGVDSPAPDPAKRLAELGISHPLRITLREAPATPEVPGAAPATEPPDRKSIDLRPVPGHAACRTAMNIPLPPFFFRSLSVLALAGVFAACSPGVDMPKGTRKGYESARIVQRDPAAPAITDATERQVHNLIQNSIGRQFTANRMRFGDGDADLVVAYLVIYQEPGMTASYEQYFGYGRDASQIANIAHTRGAINSKRPEFFRQAGILIDVIDARTNKLVFRNFVKGDVIAGASFADRATRVDSAVAQAMQPFFR
jgi:hypothetical protein